MGTALPPGRDNPPGGQDSGSRAIRVWNIDTEDVPPFGAMELAGYDVDRNAFKVQRCTLTGRNDLIFNGPVPIPADMEGQARGDEHAGAAFSPDDGEQPDPGEVWGVEAGSWVLSPNYPGYLIVDTTAASRSFCVVRSQRHHITEHVRVTGAPLSTVPANFCDAILKVFDPPSNTWVATDPAIPVWFRDSTGRTLKAKEYKSPFDVQCQRTGFRGGRPVYVGYANPAGMVGPDTSGDGGGAGCFGYGWVTVLTTSDCLFVSVDGIDSGLKLTSTDAATWENADATLTICEQTFYVSFTKGDCNGPCMTLTTATGSSVTYTGTRDCGGCSYAVFAFPTAAICGTDDAGGDPCDRMTQVRVDWAECYTQAFDVGPICCGDDLVTFPRIICMCFGPSAGTLLDGTCKILVWNGVDKWVQDEPANAGNGFTRYEILCNVYPASPAGLVLNNGAGGVSWGGLYTCDGGVNFYIDYTTYGTAFPWVSGSCGTANNYIVTECGGNVPRTLVCTKLTGCANLTSSAVPMIYPNGYGGDLHAWLAQFPCDGFGGPPPIGGLQFTMECVDGEWFVTNPITHVDATVTSTSYNPFVLEFSFPETGGPTDCCPGTTATFIVTES